MTSAINASDPTPRDSAWSGTVRLTPGRLTYIGDLGSAHAHAHAAVQLLLVEAGHVTLTDEDGTRLDVQAALVPAGCRTRCGRAEQSARRVPLQNSSRAA